jgi:hypothetical protein
LAGRRRGRSWRRPLVLGRGLPPCGGGARTCPSAVGAGEAWSAMGEGLDICGQQLQLQRRPDEPLHLRQRVRD